MDKVYTCLCGSQKFQVHGSFIRCGNCQREFKLWLCKWPEDELESPKDFNLRIRKED